MWWHTSETAVASALQEYACFHASPSFRSSLHLLLIIPETFALAEGLVIHRLNMLPLEGSVSFKQITLAPFHDICSLLYKREL